MPEVLDRTPATPVAWDIARYLEQQQSLTAVEKFAQRHAGRSEPLQAKYYRDLIPLEAPQPGQQYAFEVDLDQCSGCKACVTACHELNGLDEDETWRSVGLLHGGAYVVLGESLGSMAANLHAGPGRLAVGVDINATHTRSATSGFVTGVCTPVHLGRSMTVHEIAVSDEQGRRCSTIRITNLIKSVDA